MSHATTKPVISPSARAEAHRLATTHADALFKRGCTVKVSSDDNGLPVITYTEPLAVQSITISITVKQ